MSPIIETSAGRIQGIEEHGLLVFRGIPYAAPPTGARRFRAPLAPAPWAGVRSATTFGPMSLQNMGPIGTLLGGTDARQDEDCLSLNVWTPGAHGRRPVMVWIHGGAFTIGAGSQAIYDGARLARRGDVVIVSINYRLGVLGRLFLAAVGGTDLDTTANAALLDQVLALRWVQTNIAAFGGDPSCVTIFGESAGSMSVSALLGTPAAQGLFHRAIAQSGALNFVSDADRGAGIADHFLHELGIGRHDLDALWRTPAPRLLEVQQRAFPRLAEGLPFQPIVDGDVLPVHPLAAITAGGAASVPLLIGTNLEEMKLFGMFDPAFKTLDAAGLARRCERAIPGIGAHGLPHAARAVTAYTDARAARGESVTPSELWYAIDSDRTFRHPAMRLAERHARHQPDTYAYLFTWRSPLLGGRIGAGHAVEIPFVFGTLDDPMISQLTGRGPDADQLSHHMQEAWLTFAHGGRPRMPDSPTWPRYDGTRRATVVLGRDRGIEDAPREAERRFWDDVT